MRRIILKICKIGCSYLDIIRLSSPTMHEDELKYVTEAYETNWMSTVAIMYLSIFFNHIGFPDTIGRAVVIAMIALAISIIAAMLYRRIQKRILERIEDCYPLGLLAMIMKKIFFGGEDQFCKSTLILQKVHYILRIRRPCVQP